MEEINLKFTLSDEELAKCVRTMTFRRKLPLRIAESVLLAAICFLYLQAIIVDRTYTMGYMLFAISLFVLLSVWVVPLRQTQSAIRNAKERSLDFDMKFGDEVFTVTQEDSYSELPYDEDIEAKVRDGLIIIIIKKIKLFCVPMRAGSDEDIAALKRLLSDKLGKRFKQ